MGQDFSGRGALVTGAAAGFGRRIAELLAAAGATGVAFDRVAHEPPLGFVAVTGDVAHEADLARAVAAAVEHAGRLDLVVANAGIVPPWRETEALDLDEWDRVFAVNVRGVAATIKHAVPALRAAGGGAIVAMASMNAARAHPRQCAYTASKHAVLGIVRATALDLGRHGIRVNAVAPGPVATAALVERMTKRAAAGGLEVEDALRRHAGETALGRMVTADDVAETVLHLLGPGSAGMTGQMLTVDAGLA